MLQVYATENSEAAIQHSLVQCLTIQIKTARFCLSVTVGIYSLRKLAHYKSSRHLILSCHLLTSQGHLLRELSSERTCIHIKVSSPSASLFLKVGIK